MAYGVLQTRKFGQNPLVLVWVTNMSTSLDLYIRYSTILV